MPVNEQYAIKHNTNRMTHIITVVLVARLVGAIISYVTSYAVRPCWLAYDRRVSLKQLQCWPSTAAPAGNVGSILLFAKQTTQILRFMVLFYKAADDGGKNGGFLWVSCVLIDLLLTGLST